MVGVDTDSKQDRKLVPIQAEINDKEIIMDSNYKWQEFSANSRTDNYRKQAEAQRQLKQAKADDVENGSRFNKAGFALIVGVVLIVAGFFLSSCQAGEVPVVEAKAESAAVGERRVASGVSASRTEIKMADRIRFQDQLEANAERNSLNVNSSTGTAVTMADRIRFQDQLWESDRSHRVETTSTRSYSTMSMAERHLFHDRLQR